MRSDLKFSWKLFLESSMGKNSLKDFECLSDADSIYDFAIKYNPEIAKTITKDSFVDICETLWFCAVSEYEPPESFQEAESIYEDLIMRDISEDGFTILPPDAYSIKLNIVPFLSQLLYIFAPNFFIPYMFIYKFKDLVTIFDYINLDLPDIPSKTDYRERCMFYWKICLALNNFRVDNDMSHIELCAFIYCFIPNMVNLECSFSQCIAQNAWFIGGKFNPMELGQTSLFWQANEETKKGDIFVFYETSPVSAITGIWIAKTDGVIDPIFRYYSNAYMGNCITIPSIKINELKSDYYFSNHPLVRKNFQGVNGWRISSEDYANIIRLLSMKGFDITVLPQLYTPTIAIDKNIRVERDVESKLLEPLLSEMGLNEGQDYIRQLGIHAGRGHRVFTDYALFYSNKVNEESANVVIEAKFHIASNKDLNNAFNQARSYALLLSSEIIVLCDKECLMVYKKESGAFNRSKYNKFYWEELRIKDSFDKFKRLIITHRY